MIGIPLAAGLWIPIFHWQLNPMFGAAAMSLSSVCVVTNALRLNFFGVHNAKKDKKLKNPIMLQTVSDIHKKDAEQMENKLSEKENQTMEKTMEIKGMMCGHCQEAVKKALEAIDGVTEAVVSYGAGNALVKMSVEVADDVLKAAVEERDYEVTAIY